MLKDCAVFYKTHIPFDIVYDPALRQIGNTDYANAAADFSFAVDLPPAEVAFKVINDLISGLEATGQRATWDFEGWPLINGAKYPAPETVVFGGNRTFTFTVVAAETANASGYMRVLTQAEHCALPEQAAKRQNK